MESIKEDFLYSKQMEEFEKSKSSINDYFKNFNNKYKAITQKAPNEDFVKILNKLTDIKDFEGFKRDFIELLQHIKPNLKLLVLFFSDILDEGYDFFMRNIVVLAAGVPGLLPKSSSELIGSFRIARATEPKEALKVKIEEDEYLKVDILKLNSIILAYMLGSVNNQLQKENNTENSEYYFPIKILNAFIHTRDTKIKSNNIKEKVCIEEAKILGLLQMNPLKFSEYYKKGEKLFYLINYVILSLFIHPSCLSLLLNKDFNILNYFLRVGVIMETRYTRKVQGSGAVNGIDEITFDGLCGSERLLGRKIIVCLNLLALCINSTCKYKNEYLMILAYDLAHVYIPQIIYNGVLKINNLFCDNQKSHDKKYKDYKETIYTSIISAISGEGKNQMEIM